MALVKCKECKKEISSAALTCPYCGIPEPGKYVPCLVTVHRHAFSILATKIFVDNGYVGEVHNERTASFEVIPGKRILSLRASLLPRVNII